MSDPNRDRVQLETGRVVSVVYTNHRNITQTRELRVAGPPYWGTTEWHPQPQWLVPAVDAARNDGIRMFALAGMTVLPT